MKRLVCGVLVVILAACARLAPPTLPSIDSAKIEAFNAWRITARLAVQRDDKGFNSDLDWRQGGERFDLRVMAPLTGGTFALSGDSARVTLLTPEGEHFVAPDAETLMQQHLGWSLALAGTRYWIRGIARPGAGVSQAVRDARGRLTDFAQDGWRIKLAGG